MNDATNMPWSGRRGQRSTWGRSPHSPTLFARLVLAIALLALFLPAALAQDTTSEASSETASLIYALPSTSPSPSKVQAPTPGQTAAEGAPTTMISDVDQIILELTDEQPVYVLEMDLDVKSVSLVFNLHGTSLPMDIPRILVSTGSPAYYFPGRTIADKSSGGTEEGGYNRRNGDVWEVQWIQGYANWTYGISLEQGVVDRPSIKPSFLIGRGIGSDILYDPELLKGENVSVSVTVTTDFNGDNVLINHLSEYLPFVGDSTAHAALLFSPILFSDTMPQPSYPNYTLPGPQLALPEWDSVRTNVPLNSTTAATNFPFGREKEPVFLGMLETATSPVPLGLAYSNYAIDEMHLQQLDKGILITSAVTSQVQWVSVGGEEGFRAWILNEGLTPNTNYTVWMYTQDRRILTKPVFFKTKNEDFSCNLYPPTEICPGIAHSVPYPPIDDQPYGDSEGVLQPGVIMNPVANVPSELTDLLEANLDAFSKSLSASGLACGRDMYSFVSTCLDCDNAYRNWLCHLLLPRCVDPAAEPFRNTSGKHAPTKAISIPRTTDTARNGNLPAYAFDYTEMLPCIGLCTTVERKCPNSLGFTCPHRNFNANDSYAFITKDNKKNDGSASTGWPAQDTWGNRWCSG